MKHLRLNGLKLLCVLGLSLMLASCATPPEDAQALQIYQQTNDPLEPYNRFMTDFNFKVNRYVYKPFSRAYRAVLPEPVRTGLSQVSTNLSQPYYMVNGILQGDLDSAAQSFGRFFTNSTLGIAGLFDVATMLGIESPKKDFGQTLYRWGWNQSMPYFVWPFLGPSDIRETTGSIIGFFINPIDYALPRAEMDHLLLYRYLLQGVVTIDSSTGLLENAEKNSLDPYVMLRTMYRQNRAKFLNEGDIDAQTDAYNFDFEDEEDE